MRRRAAAIRSRPRSRKAGYDSAGLYASATGGKPVLCAACHGSNALPGTGIEGISPLTTAVHAGHAGCRRPRDRAQTRRFGQPLGLLPLPPRLRHALPARRHGERRGRRRHDGDAVPELPWRNGAVGSTARQGWLQEPDLPGLPHRHGHQQRRADALHLRLRRRRQSARTREPDVRHQSGHARRRALAVPLLERTRRACSAKRATVRLTPSSPVPTPTTTCRA